MTTVRLIPMNEGLLFECSGHADYAEKGKDIVCAGISALCIALTESVEELADEKETELVGLYTADGFLSVEVRFTDDTYSRTKTLAVFNTAMNGLRAIEALYPEHLLIA